MLRTDTENECSFSTARCHDAWQHGSSFHGGEYHYEQLDSGAFEAQSVEAWLGPIQIIYEEVNKSVRYHGRTLRESRLFVIRAQQGPEHYVNGRIARSESICMERGDALSAAWCQGGLKAVAIVADETTLLQHMRATHPDVSLLPASGRTRVINAPPAARKLLAQCTDAMNFAYQMHSRPQTVSLRRLVESLLDSLIEGLLLDEDDDHRSKIYFPALNVERAHEYVTAHMEGPLTVLDLCKALRISRRALQQSFQDVTGVSPVRYLLQLRLNRVHRELVERRGEVRVQDVAMRWGFWHLGRFAQFYRRAFGVLPSQTQRTGKLPDLHTY